MATTNIRDYKAEILIPELSSIVDDYDLLFQVRKITKNYMSYYIMTLN